MTFSRYVNYLLEKTNKLCVQSHREDRRAEYLYAVMLMEMTEPYYPEEWVSDQPYEKERLMCLLERSVCVAGYKKHTEQLCNKIKSSGEGDSEIYDKIILAASKLADSEENKVLTADFLFVSVVLKLNSSFLNGIVPGGPSVVLEKLRMLDFTHNEDAANYPSRRAVLNNILTLSPHQFKDCDGLKEHILSSIRCIRFINHTDVMLPVLLPGTDRCLVLSVGMMGEKRVVSDNGAAAKALKALSADYDTCKQRLEKLSVEMLGFVPPESGELRGVINTREDFLRFLQTVFIATYLDVFDVTISNESESYRKAITQFDEQWSGRSDSIETMIKHSINKIDMGESGTEIKMNFVFRNESIALHPVLCSSSEGAYVTYTDEYGGVLYEKVLLQNVDEIEKAERIIKILCDAFACQQEGECIRMYYDCTDIYSTPAAIFKFLYLASVLGEYGGLLS